MTTCFEEEMYSRFMRWTDIHSPGINDLYFAELDIKNNCKKNCNKYIIIKETIANLKLQKKSMGNLKNIYILSHAISA